ncbi:MAG: glycosyl hydrolase, partial [Kiritimatiellaeota bacterium]|nr:glycosyl hydrolase [Kiritimatiellota bacterium]
MKRIIAMSVVALGLCASLRADELEKNFAAPPAAARPWVYWFPLSGNLTREGITADLEAMARVGIGGALYMEVDQGAPKGPADFAGPLWRDLFKHACNEAHRLGLEINMNNDAGWCGSGGPWITPELSMQKVVWSELALVGGKKFEGVLPQPETVKDFYRDIAVLAFPTPAGDCAKMSAAAPKFSSSAASAKAGRFTFNRAKEKEPPYVQIEFAQPFTARMLTARLANGRYSVQCHLQSSDDGKNFRTVRTFGARPPVVMVNFEPVTARYYRLGLAGGSDPKLVRIEIAKVELGQGYRIENIQGKSALVTDKLPPAGAVWPATPAQIAIARDSMVDLSAQLDATGKLTWDVPAGNWTVMRFGRTTTGKDNHPAPESGRGLECDKLSKSGAAAMFNGLMGKLIAENKALTGQDKALVATHIDSWEVGSQNWTPRMREEFQQRRGYDLWKYLPAFTGRVVESVEVTERFLWDLRQTVSDLLVENYAGEFRRLANQHGLRLSIEAYGQVPVDDMAYASQADEPMAEFWSWSLRGGDDIGAARTCTEMASAAHIYGKRILGAEAFTAASSEKWQGHPANIKALGDWAFCEGINRFVFHRYAAQPWTNVAPGMSMGPWGLHYERTQTWWEQSKAWHEYLARCQYLLQQGLFVADVAYLQPEGAPRAFAPPADAESAPHIRGGYNFDGCTPDVVLTRMQVKDGRIVLPDGMSYRLLVLPEVETMTPRLLRKVKELADAGALVMTTAKPPKKSPSLADMGAADAEVAKIAGELWPKLLTGKSAAEVLAARGVKPDFSAKPALRHIHRSAGDTEIYFVANPDARNVAAIANFRVTGKQPELWWPDSSRRALALAFEEHDGVTSVPLQFEPSGSVFVIFRKAAKPAEQVVSVTRDGKELLSKSSPPAAMVSQAKDVSKTFTITAWVKPEADTVLPTESGTGRKTYNAKRNDLLYPPPGHEVWTVADAGAGLAVGNNGVCVHEHGANHFPAVLVCPEVLT